MITVAMVDRPAAVAVALAVVSEALRHRVVSPTAAGMPVADLARLPSQIRPEVGR